MPHSMGIAARNPTRILTSWPMRKPSRSVTNKTSNRTSNPTSNPRWNPTRFDKHGTRIVGNAIGENCST